MNDEMLNTLLNPSILIAAGAIVALLETLPRVFKIKKNAIWRRLVPILPLAFGVGGAFLPGVVEPEPKAYGARIVIGLWIGFVAAHGRKIIKRIAIDRLEGLK